MRDFWADYIAESPDLMPFYARPARTLFTSLPKTQRWDPALVDAVSSYNEELGGRAVFSGDEAAVVTGQQAGLLTGPLYAVYKAATAVLLARKLQARSGRLCAPVFWVASDDHDFDEIRTAHLLTKSHEVLSLRYEPSIAVDGLPANRVPVEGSLHAVIDSAAGQTQGSEHRNAVATFLHESLDASASLADWTARIMARLFRDTPLIVFAPHLPEARALAQPVIERAVREPLLVSQLVNETGERIEDLGYPRAVVKGADECAFFLEVEGRRCKVVFDNACFRIPDTDRVFAPEEMASLAASDPGRFSANVALRCLVQQQLFPAVAYVAGPGELAYWGQFKQLFEVFGQEMPVIFPRARCILSSTKLNQLQTKLGLTREDLAQAPDVIADAVLRRMTDEAVKTIVAEHRGAIMDAWRRFGVDLDTQSKTAAAMAEKAAGRIEQEIERIERALMEGDTARVAAVRGQVTRLCTAFFPLRKPQERVLNIFSFLFEYGWDLVPRLLKEIDIESFAVKEIEL